MDLPDAWIDAAKILGGLITAFGLGTAGVLAGRKKGGEPRGEAQVIAGSFTDRQALIDVGVAVRNLDGTARELLEEVRGFRADHEVEERVKAELRARGLPPA